LYIAKLDFIKTSNIKSLSTFIYGSHFIDLQLRRIVLPKQNLQNIFYVNLQNLKKKIKYKFKPSLLYVFHLFSRV